MAIVIAVCVYLWPLSLHNVVHHEIVNKASRYNYTSMINSSDIIFIRLFYVSSSNNIVIHLSWLPHFMWPL